MRRPSHNHDAGEPQCQLGDLAHRIGIGHADPTGTNSRIIQAINRLIRFDYLRQAVGYPEVYEVRTKIPPLSRRHAAQLPPRLQADAPVV